MKTINIRNIFPEYELDCFIEVPDEQYEIYLASLTQEIAAIYIEFNRAEDAWNRQRSRYCAYYSLDYGDGIEREALHPTLTPDQIHEHKFNRMQLNIAISSLPEKQARRIYAHFFLGMSKTKIAQQEGVHRSRVTHSIQKGLSTLKRELCELIV